MMDEIRECVDLWGLCRVIPLRAVMADKWRHCISSIYYFKQCSQWSQTLAVFKCALSMRCNNELTINNDVISTRDAKQLSIISLVGQVHQMLQRRHAPVQSGHYLLENCVLCQKGVYTLCLLFVYTLFTPGGWPTNRWARERADATREPHVRDSQAAAQATKGMTSSRILSGRF